MLPNSAASKLPPSPSKNANSARPSAKDAVVMTPIAASDFSTRRRVTPLIISADATPHAPAPSRKLMPSSVLAAKPPKIACDRPWPM